MNNATDNFKKHTSKNFLQRWLINNFYDVLISIVTKLNSESILDVGCGEGFTLSLLAKKNVDKTLEGIDSSVVAINIGKTLFPKISLKTGDIYNLPYEHDSFELVICSEVLEHLEDPGRALQELKRVSKKYCLFSVPNEPIFRLANFFRGKNISRWGNDIEHINHWSIHEFSDFIGGKLKILEKRLPFPWIMVLAKKNNL